MLFGQFRARLPRVEASPWLAPSGAVWPRVKETLLFSSWETTVVSKFRELVGDTGSLVPEPSLWLHHEERLPISHRLDVANERMTISHKRGRQAGQSRSENPRSRAVWNTLHPGGSVNLPSERGKVAWLDDERVSTLSLCQHPLTWSPANCVALLNNFSPRIPI